MATPGVPVFHWPTGQGRPKNGKPMTNEWDMDLARLSLRATMLTLEMLTATGRDDGERLERHATPVVDALFQFLLTAATDRDAAEAARESVVAKAQRSPSAIRKQTTGVTPDGTPVHSFRTLLADLTTLARNTIVTAVAPNLPLTVFSRPTPVQQRAFDLLEIAL